MINAYILRRIAVELQDFLADIIGLFRHQYFCYEVKCFPLMRSESDFK